MFDPRGDPATVIVGVAGSPVADQSALRVIEAVAGRYVAAGKTPQPRHISRDCHRLPTHAGHLMVDGDDDPDDAIAATLGVRTGNLGGH